MTRRVAVIGAGAVGAMCAIHLLRAGHHVTIVEPGTPGGEQAASFGNSGWLSAHSVIPPAEPGVWRKVPGYLADSLGPVSIRWSHLPRAAPWLLRYVASAATPQRLLTIARALRTLLVDAPKLHAEIAGLAGVSQLVVQSGVLHLYRSREAFERDELAWDVRRSVGVQYDTLEGDVLRAQEPHLAPEYGFAVRVGETGHCRDPSAYVRALFEHARSTGAGHVAARATGLRIEGARLRAVRTENDDVDCDAAVIAAGMRSRPLATAAGDRVPLETERGYHVQIARAEGAPNTPMMVMDRKVVATHMSGGLRVGGQVEIAAIDDAPDWRRADILRRHALDLFPSLPRDLPPERITRWMGCRPSLPDGLPCIGPSSASADVVHAFGHGHVGLAASARTGRVIAQVLSGQAPDIALAPFAAQRFRRAVQSRVAEATA
jgi:D-amino-acid dehydrogenase